MENSEDRNSFGIWQRVIAPLVKSRGRGVLVTGDRWTSARGVESAGGHSNLRPLVLEALQ